MTQLKQDVDGDILFENNQFSLVEGEDEIRQRLIQNLKTFLGEWFLDTTIGVPYHQLIFVKDTPASVVEDLLKDEILNTVDVIGLNRFEPLDLDRGPRLLSVDFEVQTIFGPLALEVSP